MSTEWQLFAFDDVAYRQHVLAPAALAARTSAADSWQALLAKLEHVYPPAQLLRHGITGAKRPVTAVDWYAGLPPLSAESPPAPGSKSLDALLKQSLECLASLRLVGSCWKPSGAFGELGYPASLADSAEQAQFRDAAATLFGRQGPPAEPYAFLEHVNHRVGVALPDTVQRLAATEGRVGLWARLSRDLPAIGFGELAKDLESMRLFLAQAAALGLAVYYREDST